MPRSPSRRRPCLQPRSRRPSCQTTVLCEIRDGIATLTLNRPDRLNAVSYELADALLAHLDDLEVDDRVRAVNPDGRRRQGVLPPAATSTSSTRVSNRAPPVPSGISSAWRRMTARIEAFPKPSSPAVNGLAYGGGCEIPEAAHLAVASDAARFAKPEIAIGIPPTFGGHSGCPGSPAQAALELLLTRRSVRTGAGPRPRPGQCGRARRPGPGRGARPGGTIIRHSPLAAAAIIAAGHARPEHEHRRRSSDRKRTVREKWCRQIDIREGLSAWIDRRPPGLYGDLTSRAEGRPGAGGPPARRRDRLGPARAQDDGAGPAAGFDRLVRRGGILQIEDGRDRHLEPSGGQGIADPLSPPPHGPPPSAGRPGRRSGRRP